MENIFLFLGFFLLLTTISESRTITPRGLPKDGSSGHGEIPISLNPLEKDRRLEHSPGIWDQPGGSHGVPKVEYEYEDTNHQPSDYDYTKPAEGENEVDNKAPGMIPDEFPSNVDRDGGPVGVPGTKDDESVDDTHEVEKSHDDEEFHGEEDFNNSEGDRRDSWDPADEEEDKSIHKDESDFHHGEDAVEKEPEHGDDDRKGHVPVDEEEDDKDNEKHVPEDEEEHIPDDEHEEKFDEHDKDESDEKKDTSKDDEESDEHDSDDDDEKKDVPKDDEESDEHDKSDDDEKKDEESDDEDEESKDNDEESDEHDKDDDNEEEKDDDDDKNVQDGESGFLNGSSIFDTPFFNLEQVKKYFGHLDRALGYVFRQTMEDGILLNGTYANTTEEEVEIDGKKYIVQKSLIKGPGNSSSIYVESLSSKSKLNNDTKDLEDTEAKNGTET